MAGHGDKIGRKAEAAIAALLSEPTVEKAAEKAGVGYRTLKGWLADPAFASAYRAARAAVLDEALAALTRCSSEAVEALRRNLVCGDEAVEVRAAKTALELLLKLEEHSEFDGRLAAVEAAMKGKQT